MARAMTRSQIAESVPAGCFNIDLEMRDLVMDVTPYHINTGALQITRVPGAVGPLTNYKRKPKVRTAKKQRPLEESPVELKPLRLTVDTPELERVIMATAHAFGITREILLKKTRERSSAFPRQVAMYIMRGSCGYSWHSIGNFLGMDHTSIMHGCNTVGNKLAGDAVLKERIEIINQSLNSQSL